MNINQDDFNKFVTTSLLVYCMVMFTLSWYTGKQLDLQSFLTLVTPLLAHTIHIVADSRKEVATINKDAAVAVTNGALTDNTKAVVANTAATERNGEHK